MAPLKSEPGGSQKITSFFKKFAIPPEGRPHPNTIEHEITVATPSSRASTAAALDDPLYGRRSTRNSPRNPASQTSVRDTPQRRGRPRKESTSSLSSVPSFTSTPRRGRGRPPKSSLSNSPHALRDSSVHPKNATPKKSPLRLNLKPVTGATDVTPNPHSAYRQQSGTPSRRRTTPGAKLPSPSRPASPISVPVCSAPMAAPPVPAVSRPLPTTAPAPVASFSSISTLSSAPLSSQATSAPISTSSSSKRVVSGGLKGVTNSDSESGDSDDDLPDVSTFFAFKKPKLSPAVESGSSKRTASSVKPSTERHGDREQAVKKSFQRSLNVSPPRKKFRNSLSSLVMQHEAWQLSEAKIASFEQEVADSNKREKEEEQDEALNERVGHDVIEANAGSDEEQRERMILALERTEALRDSDRYYFFLDNRPRFDNTPFPTDSLPDEPWTKLYNNDQSRRQACISGFAAEMAAHHPLPVAVTNWFAQQLLYERDESLCEAYVNILKVASHAHTSFSETIASLSSIYHTRSFFENGPKDQLRKGLPPGLKYLTRVIQFCAPASDSIVPDAVPSTTTAALLDLAMMSIDEHVKQDAALTLQIATCIEGMLDALPQSAFEMLVTQAIGTLFLPDHLASVIRCRVIYSLPAGSTRAYQLRRRLALETFSTSANHSTADGQDWTQSIIKSLKSRPEFAPSETTDYNLLLVMIDVLDIAISAGFTPYAELHPQQPAASGLLFKSQKPSAAAKLHNAQIDAVVSELNYIASRIRDAGTTHLRRTEVKSAIERVVARLESAVRTRMKPKKSVFGRPVFEQVKFDKSNTKSTSKLKEKPSTPGLMSGDEHENSQASTPKALQPDGNLGALSVAHNDRKTVEPDEALLSDREPSEGFQTCAEFNTQSQ